VTKHEDGLTTTSLGDDWTLWPDLVVRSSGFPVHMLEELCATEAAARLAALEAWGREVGPKLVAHLERMKEHRRAVPRARKIHRDLRTGDILGALARVEKHGQLEDASTWLAEGQALDAAVDEALAGAEDVINRSLRDVMLDPRLREAVTWQNRKGLASVLTNLGHRRGRQRHVAELAVAAYVQRYVAKNDTAGFFGPRVWGKLGARTEVEPGARLVTGDSLILEYWAVAALAATMDGLAGVKEAFAPRLHPSMRFEDGKLITLFGAMPVEGLRASLLEAIDAVRPANDVADALVASGAAPDRDAVFAELGACAEQGLVLWSIEVPNERAPFEAALRDALERCEEPASREEASSRLDAIEELRSEALAARGDPEKVALALDALDERFVTLSGKAALQKEGQMYAGRTLLQLDSVRDLSITIGPELTRAVEPLGLVLQSARWLSRQLGDAYEDAFRSIYERISAEIGSPLVPLTRFYGEALPLFRLGRSDGDLPAEMGRAVDELGERWGQVLGLEEASGPVHCTYDELAPKVASAFACDAAGWPSARTHSPDLMVAAADVDAIRRGDFFVVLGELHPFIISVENEVLVEAHPNPASLRSHLDRSYPEGRVVYNVPPQVPSRHMARPVAGGTLDVHLDVPGTTPSAGPGQARLAASALFVTHGDSGLEVVSLDGSRRFNGFDFLNNTIVPPFDVVPSGRTHVPRVTVDQLVLSRERWRIAVDELDFPLIKDRMQRWKLARRWAVTAGIPRRCFYRVKTETKPMFLDFDAPPLVSLFVRQLRAQAPGATFSISEMLPTPDQCWLPDAADARYTSELRLVVREAPHAPLNGSPNVG
jgi:Lantibiotic dehydratase, N terminus